MLNYLQFSVVDHHYNMNSPAQYSIVSAETMHAEFVRVLLKNGLDRSRAEQCATIFTESSIDGIYTHGVNRFERFIHHIERGIVIPTAEPSLKKSLGNIEQWDGNLGPGILNALHATDRVTELAKAHGIACVALANTNHWLRGGTYGWRAAKKGFVFIGFTNTIANMPAWGALDSRLGNNPLIFAVPWHNEAIVLDMAMSQYSYGAMETTTKKGELLEHDGGFNKEGRLTNDPKEIIESRRPLSIGMWKGAGLALLLDILATVLSGGLSTHEISANKSEYSVSQVYIAIDLTRLNNLNSVATIVDQIINDYMASVPSDQSKQIHYPGQRVMETRKRNLSEGIPVLKQVWNKIIAL